MAMGTGEWACIGLTADAGYCDSVMQKGVHGPARSLARTPARGPGRSFERGCMVQQASADVAALASCRRQRRCRES